MTLVIARIALLNVVRHRRRSMAAVLAVAIGFLALSVLQGFIGHLRSTFETQARHQGMLGDLLVKKKRPPNIPPERSWEVRLDEEDQALVERVLSRHTRSVSGFMRKLIIGGLVTNGEASTSFVGVGYDVARGIALRGETWAWDTFAGAPLEVGQNNAVVLGRQLGKLLRCDSAAPNPVHSEGGHAPRPDALDCTTDQVQLQALSTGGRFSALTVHVKGLIETNTREMGRKLLMTDLETAQSLFDTRDVTTYSVAVNTPSDVPVIVAALQEASDRAGTDLLVGPWQSFGEGSMFRSLMALLNTFLLVVQVAAGVLSSGAVFNLLTRTVQERTREIGTLRSLGFRSYHLLSIFGIEGILLAVAGCAFGVLAAYGVSAALSDVGITFTGGLASTPLPLAIETSPAPMLSSAALLTACCTLASLLPARRAAQTTIIDALLHT